MYGKIQQLIDAAYRRSGTVGTGQTPGANASTQALEDLNGILDIVAIDRGTSAGLIRKAVTPYEGKVVFANDGARIITYVTASNSTHLATISTVTAHGAKIADSIDLFNTGIVGLDGTYTVTALPSSTSFTVNGIQVNGNAYQGTWKLSSESRDYRIDVATEPPTDIDYITETEAPLLQLTADDFYSRPLYNGEYYYETATNPYPTLFLAGGAVSIAYRQPGFVNVGLNTSITHWPRGLDQAVMNKLAGILAAGYPETVATCEAAYNNYMAQYKLTHRKTKSTIMDDSSPGFGRGYYDIDTDRSW